MKHMGSFKAYVHDFSAQMNATPNMNKFARIGIFNVGCKNVWWTLHEDVAGIIKIAERCEANGPPKKSQAAHYNKVA